MTMCYALLVINFLFDKKILSLLFYYRYETNNCQVVFVFIISNKIISTQKNIFHDS